MLPRLENILFFLRKKSFTKQNNLNATVLEDPRDEFAFDARRVVGPGKAVLSLAGFFFGVHAVQNRERF